LELKPERYSFTYKEIDIRQSAAFPNRKSVWRPYLEIILSTQTSEYQLRSDAWLDSGADHCVFPLSFTASLGLNLSTMKKTMILGHGGIENPTYFSDVIITIPAVNQPPITFTAFAGFAAGLEELGAGVLGHAGFFDSFAVLFEGRRKSFTIVT